jgi:hypothetical protein
MTVDFVEWQEVIYRLSRAQRWHNQEGSPQGLKKKGLLLKSESPVTERLRINPH